MPAIEQLDAQLDRRPRPRRRGRVRRRTLADLIGQVRHTGTLARRPTTCRPRGWSSPTRARPWPRSRACWPKEPEPAAQVAPSWAAVVVRSTSSAELGRVEHAEGAGHDPVGGRLGLAPIPGWCGRRIGVGLGPAEEPGHDRRLDHDRLERLQPRGQHGGAVHRAPHSRSTFIRCRASAFGSSGSGTAAQAANSGAPAGEAAAITFRSQLGQPPVVDPVGQVLCGPRVADNWRRPAAASRRRHHRPAPLPPLDDRRGWKKTKAAATTVPVDVARALRPGRRCRSRRRRNRARRPGRRWRRRA